MRRAQFIAVAGIVTGIRASESVFSVNDDLFAFPQYAIEFQDSYILEEHAVELLKLSTKNEGGLREQPPKVEVGSVRHGADHSADSQAIEELSGTYERMMLYGQPYLCHIPEVESDDENKTVQEPSAEEKEKEMVLAASRGAQLLEGMAANQCLYYSTGWWTYSFCYNAQITQFHSLPAGTNGRMWPPQEDPTTPSYVLGKFDNKQKTESPSDADSDQALTTELQSKAETNYLVQRLEGGTPCDLTGRDRKVEVQFHCNPQLTDRIGWIKETATCAYLMVIYTPRLCNDVAFQPPKESRAYPITCREIISEDEVEEWEASYEEDQQSLPSIEETEPRQVVLGNVVVGAMKYLGKEGKKLERGRIVLTQDEKAETVVMRKDGKISSLSKADMKKLDLSPEDIESFMKELQKLAGSKDWKIERLDDVHGHVQLRGVVSDDGNEEETLQQPSGSQEEKDGGGGEQEGSKEEYRDEE